MNCYDCAIQGESAPAVAVCKHCGVGMCLEHLYAQLDYRGGGTTYGCRHEFAARPTVKATARASGHTHHWLRAAR